MCLLTQTDPQRTAVHQLGQRARRQGVWRCDQAHIGCGVRMHRQEAVGSVRACSCACVVPAEAAGPSV